MAKYFIDTEIYYNGKKQAPKKVILPIVHIESSGDKATCYDEDGDEYTLRLNEIFEDNDNPIKDARERLGISQEKFSKKYDIPKRTIEDWESGKSKPPRYVMNMLLEKVFSEIVYYRKK